MSRDPDLRILGVLKNMGNRWNMIDGKFDAKGDLETDCFIGFLVKLYCVRIAKPYISGFTG